MLEVLGLEAGISAVGLGSGSAGDRPGRQLPGGEQVRPARQSQTSTMDSSRESALVTKEGCVPS